MNNTPSCPECGSRLQGATCPTCPSPSTRPGWPWLGSGAIVLAVVLTLWLHWPQPAHPSRSPQPSSAVTPVQQPPPSRPAPLPPQPVPPQSPPPAVQQPDTTGNNKPAHSPAETLFDESPGQEATPSPPVPEPAPDGKLAFGSDLDLFKAVKRKDLAKVRALLTSFPALVKERNYKGATGMQLAAAQDDVAMVRLFLADGAEVDAKCNQLLYAGQTALHLAAGQGYTDVATVLLAHGANVAAKNFTGETPLVDEAAIKDATRWCCCLASQSAYRSPAARTVSARRSISRSFRGIWTRSKCWWRMGRTSRPGRTTAPRPSPTPRRTAQRRSPRIFGDTEVNKGARKHGEPRLNGKTSPALVGRCQARDSQDQAT